ncbi:MAG: ThuA domain-containing protein, partial [Planctomycetes bacterium]|nr:ThuA domain-containing protein [Planctomycetota bacterium]
RPARARAVQVAYERPIAADELHGRAGHARIEPSPWTRAGDRFESLRPGYAVVQMQTVTPRFDLPVAGVQVTPDRRTLVLNTAPHRKLDHYALTLPWESRKGASADHNGALPQHPQIDLHYTLNGVEAVLSTGEGAPLWEGWLPHLDLRAAEDLTMGSGQHESLWKQLREGASANAASLTLRTKLDLANMLRAAVQPGSQLGFEYPPETVTLVFKSTAPLKVRSSAAKVEDGRQNDGVFTGRATFESPMDEPIPLEVRLSAASADDLKLDVAWRTQEDGRLRQLPLRRMYVPWAADGPSTDEAATPLTAAPPELEGGSWGRGRQVFFGEKAQCGKCHRVGDRGGVLGPDLSNLVHRDYHSVLRDVTQPSFAINPDHLTYSLVLHDGRVLTGVVAADGDMLLVGDQQGNQHEIDRADVEEMVPSPISIMPQDIDKQLGADAMRDLLTFLLTPPPRMPSDLAGAPPPRTRAEVDGVLSGAEALSLPPRPLHIVLVAGRKDHGPGEHDYPAWLNVWGRLLEAAENVAVSRVMDWPTEEQFASADALVFYQQGTWDQRRAADIDAFLRRGGGVSYIHYAVDGGADPLGFAERIGLAWQGGASRFRHGGLDLIFDSEHPIARNFDRVHLHDESYWSLKGDLNRITLLAGGREEDALQPLVWVREHDPGRVFVSIPGHYSWTFDDPLFRTLVLRGVAWSAEEPVDRFNELVTLGARIQK